jgi:hypothetical protein
MTDVSHVRTAFIIRAIAQTMETVHTFEMSVNFYETAQRSIPEDCLHTRRRENLMPRSEFNWL